MDPFRPDKNLQGSFVFVDIPQELADLLKREFPEVYQRFSRDQEQVTHYIKLARSIMGKLFEDVLNKICYLVQREFKRLEHLKRKCDYVFLVGGFAASDSLQQRLENEFKDKVKKIVIPPNPIAAVLIGACYYGLDPSRIKTRKSRMNYGVRLSLPFEKGKDIEKQRGEGLESDRCPRRFRSLVEVGEAIAYNKRFTCRLRPIFPELATGTLEVYASSRNGVRYIDEPGVRCLGELDVQMPTDATEVEVSMFFGQTEFHVEALNMATGKAVAANFRYPQETSTSPFTEA